TGLGPEHADVCDTSCSIGTPAVGVANTNYAALRIANNTWNWTRCNVRISNGATRNTGIGEVIRGYVGGLKNQTPARTLTPSDGAAIHICRNRHAVTTGPYIGGPTTMIGEIHKDIRVDIEIVALYPIVI